MDAGRAFEIVLELAKVYHEDRRVNLERLARVLGGDAYDRTMSEEAEALKIIEDIAANQVQL